MEAAIAPTQKKKRRFGRPDHALRRANLALPGLDLRSQEGRRYALIIAELLAEHGEGELTRLRELAALRISLEQTQVEAMRRSLKAREDSVRLANLLCRRESELRTRRAARATDRAPSLKDYLARRASEGGPA